MLRLSSIKARDAYPFLKIVTPSILLVLAGLLYYGQVWGSMDAFVTAVDHCAELFCDFTRQYYPTGRNLFESATPTGGYFYSLSFAIFLVVLAQFELATAVQLWAIFQVATAVLLLFFSAHSLWQQSPRAYLLYLALLILAVPLLHNFKWGQLSTFITAGIMAALYFHQKGQTTLAALSLALATAVKYYPGLFLLYFLLKKEWRFSLTYLAACFLLILFTPLLLLGLDNNLHFYQIVSERIAHARSSWMLTDINSQYLASVAGRLLENGNGHLFWQFTGYGITALILIVICRLTQKAANSAGVWVFSLLFLATPFFVETSWPHYFVYLPFSQILVYLHLSKSEKTRGWFFMAFVLGLAMVMPTAVYFNLWPNWKVYSSYGFLFFANLLTLLLTLAALWRESYQNLWPTE